MDAGLGAECLSLAPTHERIAWVSGYISRWFTCLQTVTHPGTNRARCWLTSLMRPTTLTTKPNSVSLPMLQS